MSLLGFQEYMQESVNKAGIMMTQWVKCLLHKHKDLNLDPYPIYKVWLKHPGL